MKMFLTLTTAALLILTATQIDAKPTKETIHRGISLDTEWVSDAHGSIYTDVSTKSLGLKTTPTYLISVIGQNSLGSSTLFNTGAGGSQSNIDIDGILSKFDPFVNITGIHLPRNPTNQGFRVRLSYTEQDGRNLTIDTAKFGKWRVRWVAISDEHPKFKEKTGGSLATQIQAFEMLVNEDEDVVKGILSTDYQITMSEHLRLEKEREKVRIKREQEKRKKEEEDKKKKEEKLKKKKEKEEQEKAAKSETKDAADSETKPDSEAKKEEAGSKKEGEKKDDA